MITYLAITPGATGGASAHGTEGREVEILIVARRARQVPAIALMFGSLLSGGALASAERSPPIGTGLASSAEASKARPAALPGEMIAQAGDLGPPPSPEAIVTTPPPAPLAEDAPPPFPGYSWDPGHWIWDGAQYVWEPGKYIVQPTNGATFTPGYWQEYSRGWAWVEGQWRWGTQGEGE